MKKDPPPRFLPSGFFALRAPVLPFDVLTAWASELQAPHAGDDDLPAALEHDRQLLRQRLRALIADPLVEEALFLASPSLFASLDQWRQQPDGDRGKKVERSLVRYVQRMAARPTPFGLFAGCATGTIDATTRLELAPRATHERHTRLDMDYLCALAAALAKSLQGRLRHAPNTTLHRAADQLRYAEARVVDGGRTCHLVAAEASPYLVATLARAAGGARLDELAAALVDDEVTREDADAYVAELVDTQLLVSELAPPVTGPEPVNALIAQLRGISDGADAAAADDDDTRLARDAAARLDEAQQALAALDAGGGAPARYEAIARGLSALPVEPELARLFQVDLTMPAPLTIGPLVTAELTRAVELCARLMPRLPDGLQHFRRAFRERYDQREVRLVDVLDEELGIGFNAVHAPAAEPSPLLDGIPLPPPMGAAAEAFAWPRQPQLLAKLAGVLRERRPELVFDDAELAELARAAPLRLPDAFCAAATIVAPSSAAVDAGDFTLYLQGTAGPSGARMLGRFCHADPALDAAVRAHLAAEETRDADAIFAEVVHLPEGRLGNLLLRPTLRSHEIVYLGRSGLPPEQQLAVDDLYVSLRGDDIVLRSQRLGRRIVPRLTTAHNFTARSLGMYRFLCSLQQQHVSQVGWVWMGLDAAPFLPRVRAGRVILARARWRLSPAQLRALDVDGAALFAAARALRAELGLPRFVALEDADHTLPVDFDNLLSLETFAQLVKERPGAVLVELLVGEGELCLRGEGGRFTHEIVVPFIARAPEPAATVTTAAAAAAAEAPAPGERRFAPGSEWLYAKLYTGVAAADTILREVIAPLVRAALDEGAIDQWFFIRYNDPDFHLRVRFHGAPARLVSEVLPRLHERLAPFVADERVWRVQLDTYERELERYGGAAGIAIAEQLFHADSEAALAILAELGGDAGADARWRLALAGMDRLLDDLGFDRPGKKRVAKLVRERFHREFGIAGGWTRALGARFRRERAPLERLLAGDGEALDDTLRAGLDALARRSTALAPLARALDAATAPRDELAASFLHMHANRLVRSSARAHELVLYDFLERLYDAQLARNKP